MRLTWENAGKIFNWICWHNTYKTIDVRDYLFFFLFFWKLTVHENWIHKTKFFKNVKNSFFHCCKREPIWLWSHVRVVFTWHNCCDGRQLIWRRLWNEVKILSPYFCLVLKLISCVIYKMFIFGLCFVLYITAAHSEYFQCKSYCRGDAEQTILLNKTPISAPVRD